MNTNVFSSIALQIICILLLTQRKLYRMQLDEKVIAMQLESISYILGFLDTFCLMTDKIL